MKDAYFCFYAKIAKQNLIWKSKMKKQKNNPSQIDLEIEKRLLSLFFCGQYISTKDIVLIGRKLGISLDFKNRKTIIKELFIKVKEQNKTNTLSKLLCDLLEKRNEKLLSLIRLYPSSMQILSQQIKKTKKTIELLQKEDIYV